MGMLVFVFGVAVGAFLWEFISAAADAVRKREERLREVERCVASHDYRLTRLRSRFDAAMGKGDGT